MKQHKNLYEALKDGYTIKGVRLPHYGEQEDLLMLRLEKKIQTKTYCILVPVAVDIFKSIRINPT